MKEKTKERLEDLFFVSLAGLFFVSGAFLWLGFNNKLTELQAENTALKHHMSLLCNYIDSLPKRYRAVYEACLEQENKERR
ncbi:hypothetical protein [Pampinifervens florentissimum]|uniref:hypothetical protein n=1 Tax=Pampinifervens florentissimum TaxID=1632019 RepID=UPI0013B47958|nr:hypothetical protein [Hydrogenobacter sp. T-8]QID32301.1 hypothetical protein G3M65_00305 [Hydrogenobacter sp. T-8]